MISGTQLGQALLAISVVAGAAGHTVLKQIVSTLPGASPLLAASHILRVDVLGRLLVALLLLGLAFGAWLGALRHLELSYSYAMASASIVVVALLAAAFLGETIAPKAWLGLALIVIGCVLITPSGVGTTN